MKLDKTKNAISGTILGIILKLYQIVCPFIIRTVFFYTLGVEYLGLNSLFTSIIQMLNIAELGVGAALVFSMYKPIFENDENKICALLRLYRFYYRLIGTVVLVAGLALAPFLRYLIKGDVPNDINLYAIYFLNLGATVLSYWLFAYRNSLFNAYQRTDVISTVGIFVNTAKYALEIFVLIFLKNYYIYLMVALFAQLLNNISVAIVSLKYFPDYHPVGEIDIESKKQINRTVMDLFCSKIGQVITNSFDTIVISAFLGLTTLAIYQNYYYIISSLFAMFTVFYKACLAGIGNSLLVESEEKNYFDFKRITYIVCFALNFCVCCLLCLYQPFMKMWVKSNELILDYRYVILLTIYFFVYEETMLLALYKDGAGNWHKDRYRPLIASVINLALNITLVNIIGLYGVIISTILSYLFVNLPWIFKRLFGDVFHNINPYIYLRILLKYLFLTGISAISCVLICRAIPNRTHLAELIINLIICTIVSTTIFFIATYKQDEFESVFKLISKITSKKVKKVA